MPPDVHSPLSHSASIESLRRSIEALVADRQHLRSNGATPVTLERNRLEIIRCQWSLAAALLAAHVG